MNFKLMLNILKEKIKDLMSTMLQRMTQLLVALAEMIRRVVLAIVLHPAVIGVTALLFGLLVGARMHETGYLAGKFGKTLKGATVYLSGPCKVNGVLRGQTLNEDEVKITAIDNDKIVGVVRKTRELVECDPKLVAIDTLPLIANLRKSPVASPELENVKVPDKEPEWKKLAQKTLVMTGKCKTQDNQELPSFVNEKVDVTDVYASKDDPSIFMIAGIRLSDKFAIICASNATKYAPFVEEKTIPVVTPEPEKHKSYVGETILVTSTCFPDRRVPTTKQNSRILYYNLVNSKVQVTEESQDANGNLLKIAGASLDHGAMIVCDQSKYPFTYKSYDSDAMKLSQIKPNQAGVEADVKEINVGSTQEQAQPASEKAPAQPIEKK